MRDVAAETQPEAARDRLQQRYCLVLRWHWASGAMELHASQYLPRPDSDEAHFQQESILMIVWARGISFHEAKRWVRDEGLRGLLQYTDGTICMWSGGRPKLKEADPPTKIHQF